MKTNNSLFETQIVGIDFGTSNTTISLIDSNGFPQLIPDIKYGKSIIPTIVGYDNGTFVFGQDALNCEREKKPVFRNLKRDLGSKIKKYELFNPKTNEKETYSTQDLIIKFLEYIRLNIQKQLNGLTFAAVISSPAYFNQDQKAMLQNCFTIAGFELLSLISEPIAACISYSNENKIGNETVLVVDIGGGTTDVALVKIQEGQYEAMPTSGNSNLGGVDFTNRIADKIITHLEKIQSTTLSDEIKNYIFEVVENAKQDVTSHSNTKIILSNIIPTPTGKYKNFDFTLTREKFEQVTKDLVNKAMFPVTECLNYNDTPKSQIKKILLVGGGSLTWGIKSKLIEMFPAAKIILDSDSKYCVSKGNGLFAHYKKDFQKSIIIEKVNKSIGVLALDPNNPQEPVWKRKVVKIIHRGDDIPAFGSYTFRTSVANQKDVEIPLFQGEGYNMENCSYIGSVTLDNIGIASAGINKITVEFTVNELGILSVVAYDTQNYKKVEKEIKLDLSWVESDLFALKKAKMEEPKNEQKELDERNWTKYVKFFNSEWNRLPEIKASRTKRMMKNKLLEMQEAIKSAKNTHLWDEVEKLQKEYHHLVSDLTWNN